MGESKPSVDEAGPGSDGPAIRALAEHLSVAAEDINEWLRRPHGIPAEVLRSWIDMWDLSRRQKGC